jgi:DNA-binding PadR family transcriptional regulator
MHGYEIKKSLEDFSKRLNGSELSNNTLYPLLARYEKNGIATRKTVHQEGKPNRIQYAVTESGRIYFYRSLNNIDRLAVISREEFVIKLAFFPVLTPANRQKLLDQREEYIRQSLIDDRNVFFAPDEMLAFMDEAAAERALLPFYGQLEQGELDIIAFYRNKVDDPCLVPEEILPLVG